MIVRALLILLAVIPLEVRAASVSYLRGQDFSTIPDNWKQSTLSQFYGYEATRITGGTGAAGGLFLPGKGFNRYADLYLGGVLRRSDAIVAQGRLALKRASGEPPYLTTAYVGHFRQPVGKVIDTLGFALIGNGSKTISAAAILQFSDGSAYIGNWVTLPIGGDFLDWNYEWTPAGGSGYGFLKVEIGGKTTSLRAPVASAGLDFSLNAFGLFQPPFIDPNSNSFLWAYIGELGYTATVGRSPKVRVNAPQTITTAGRTIQIKGTASLPLGYRVARVRFRVVHEGKPGAYHRAKGTDKWTVQTRIPSGRSKIEIEAVSDSGLTRTASRVVKRR